MVKVQNKDNSERLINQGENGRHANAWSSFGGL